MKEIQVLDKTFVSAISEAEIFAAIDKLADQLTRDYQDKQPMFLMILNGSFMFAADLLKRATFPATMASIKLSSYEGMLTSGRVREVIGLTEDISGRDIIILEDIVDTGTTMHCLIPDLMQKGAKSVEICTFLHKPDALIFEDARPKYIGFEINNLFVLGYGLDYNGYGRNLPEIYMLKN
ncbi:MAG: hypoxanthine phosphoribosyltransferase [Bacteroidales bacterium]|nr:hypoxanthine phosphoribosyltransferase [Candidatus Colicola faecequi]